jgi:hypothetical protein
VAIKRVKLRSNTGQTAIKLVKLRSNGSSGDQTGQTAIKHRSNCDQTGQAAIPQGLRNSDDGNSAALRLQVPAKRWPNTGQALVKHRSSAGQTPVKRWSNTGRELVENWRPRPRPDTHRGAAITPDSYRPKSGQVPIKYRSSSVKYRSITGQILVKLHLRPILILHLCFNGDTFTLFRSRGRFDLFFVQLMPDSPLSAPTPRSLPRHRQYSTSIRPARDQYCSPPPLSDPFHNPPSYQLTRRSHSPAGPIHAGLTGG